jgi:hypothetical protein
MYGCETWSCLVGRNVNVSLHTSVVHKVTLICSQNSELKGGYVG